MINFYVTLLFLVIIVPIGVAYYYDYKANKKDFKNGLQVTLKGVFRIVISVLSIYLINSLFEALIPFNKSGGIEFNTERIIQGIPIIKDEWRLEEESFQTTYWNNNSNSKHFKKVLEHGILRFTKETDWYSNNDRSSNFVYSVYDHDNETLEYYFQTYDHLSKNKNRLKKISIKEFKRFIEEP